MVYPKQKRVNYFRGEDVIDVVESHIEDTLKFFKDYNIDLSSRKKINDFFLQLIMSRFQLRLDRIPTQENPEKKQKLLKWPKEVIMAPEQVFGSKMFYTWTETKPGSKVIGLVIVAIILFICLFPIWPYKAKLYLFYTSLYLLMAIVSLHFGFFL